MKITEVKAQKGSGRLLYSLTLTTDAVLEDGQFYTQRIMWNKDTDPQKIIVKLEEGYTNLMNEKAELKEIEERILLAKK